MQQIDIIIPTRTDDEYSRAITQASIHNLRDCEPSNVNFNVVLCEQIKGGKDYDGVDLMLHYDFPFIFNKVLNYGASHCNAEYIMFNNNDLMYSRGFLTPLFIGAQMGYESLSPSDPRNDKYTDEPYIEGYGIGKELKGWSIFCKRDMFERIGHFNEGVNFWYSDNLYADQLKKAGIKHARATHSHVVHFGETTVRRQNAKTRRDYKQKQEEIYKAIDKSTI